MRRLRLFPLALSAALGAVPLAGAGAQTPRQPPRPADGMLAEGPYARARRLVSEGHGAAGRALVDSLLAAATPGTAPYAEALFWRATLAERAADAERDYRLLAVEYGFSPRAVDAQLRLAQLDLLRGQAQSARDRLERMVRDTPDAAVQARGRYWLARVHLDAGDARAACASLDHAAAAAAPGSEIAREVAGLRPRVPNCETFLAQRPPAPRPAADSAPPRAADRTAEPAPRPTVPAGAAGAAGAGSPGTGSPAAGARRFTVQVAAYPQRAGADAAAARLVRAGLPARVSAQGPNGDRPPFRVRVGRYATPAEAAAVLRRLRARRMAGFVTEAEPEGAAETGR